MKILFILVGRSDIFIEEESKKSFIYMFLIQNAKYFERPLTIPILAALTPKEHVVKFTEADLGKIDYDGDYDIVAISTVTQCAYTAYAIADEFRKRGVFVAMGGYHPSALPEEAKQHADAVFIGESEETWPQFLKDFESGNVKPFYRLIKPVDPSLIPHPRLDIFEGKSGVGAQATRGCPYGCEFCAITNMQFGNIFRKRPVNDVIDDIKVIPNRSFFFSDNSLTINPTYTKQLFKEMKGLNKRFYAYGNIDTLGKDEELLKVASEAGCFGWFIGFESISQDSLNNIGKKTNRVNEYFAHIKKLHDYGMVVIGSFMFGFDHDTIDIFDATDEFIRSSEVDLPYSTPVIPYPGTPLFDRLDKEGRILTKDWSKYDIGHIVFKPKNMTPEELLENIKDIRSRWYSRSSNYMRSLNSLKLGFYPFLFVSIRNMVLRFQGYHNLS